MNKKKAKSKNKSKRNKSRKAASGKVAGAQPAAVPASPESRVSVASTVAWLLCCFATIVSMVITLVTLILLRSNPSDSMRFLGSVFLFVSFILGALTLILTVVCQRVRDFPPPRGITIGTTLIGLSAILMWLADQVLSR